jgi:diacylglycerol kinase family enzyme
MMIFANALAGGGTALRKLHLIGSEIRSRWGEFALETPRSKEAMRHLVASAYASGERLYVAAGGDGSVNALTEALMTSLAEPERASVRMGAIGLGSSNDFHKPFRPDGMVQGVPCTMECASARPRDVVRLRIGPDGSAETRYFLINASAGLTAEGNRLFNDPDPLLATLKRTRTSAAIFYAVFRTMVMYRNRSLTIESPGSPRRASEVTNLAIFKNPHVSGTLKFPGKACYDSGALEFRLAEDLGLAGRVRLFRALQAGQVPADGSCLAWSSPEATLRSEQPFAFEFDGEVTATREVQIRVLPGQLQVCTC